MFELDDSTIRLVKTTIILYIILLILISNNIIEDYENKQEIKKNQEEVNVY